MPVRQIHESEFMASFWQFRANFYFLLGIGSRYCLRMAVSKLFHEKIKKIYI